MVFPVCDTVCKDLWMRTLVSVFFYIRMFVCVFVFYLKVDESLKEAVSTDYQDDSSVSELRWLQKTQQLQVGPHYYFHLVDVVSPNISVEKKSK